MESLPSSIADLLLVAEGANAGTGEPRAACWRLGAYEPSLLLVADTWGNLLYFTELQQELPAGGAEALADALAREVAPKQAGTLRLPEDHSTFVIGTRLPPPCEEVILGCAVRNQAIADFQDDEAQLTAVVCAAYAWASAKGQARDCELQKRIEHLQAEHHTLKHSHTQAASEAVEERERRLEQQRQDVARLDAVMKLAADGIVTLNESGVVESFNEAAAKIFGYRPDEVIGRDIRMLLPSSPRDAPESVLPEWLTGARVSSGGRLSEILGKHRNGTVFPLEIAVSRVRLDDRCIYTGIFRDVTQRRHLEAQLVQAQKMESIGQLAAGIAHEINTPTQYVGDNTRFLEDVFQDLATVLQRCRELCRSEDQGLVSQPPVAELISAAGEADVDYLLEEIPKAIAQSLEGVDRVAAIVRSMKDFSHPGGESKQAVDLNRALTSTLTVCRNEWKYVADVVTELEPGLPLVTCLPGECNQVFLNLIINAAHAIGEKLGPNSTEKGTITVGTSHRDGFVEVRIGDTGTGVPEEAQSKLFDPFFTTKEVGRGTGQGLAIAHSIINEKHGGTIRFETEVDRGTTFIISLPVCSERELTEEPTP
jgi:PAS domain S-box-containing protein